MPSSSTIASQDRFGLWYRITSPAVISLLHIVGPAQLDDHSDPRRQAEEDYLRRRNLHRERQGKAPLTDNPFRGGQDVDPVIVSVIIGVACLLVLVAWAVASKL